MKKVLISRIAAEDKMGLDTAGFQRFQRGVSGENQGVVLIRPQFREYSGRGMGLQKPRIAGTPENLPAKASTAGRLAGARKIHHEVIQEKMWTSLPEC